MAQIATKQEIDTAAASNDLRHLFLYRTELINWLNANTGELTATMGFTGWLNYTGAVLTDLKRGTLGTSLFNPDGTTLKDVLRGNLAAYSKDIQQMAERLAYVNSKIEAIRYAAAEEGWTDPNESDTVKKATRNRDEQAEIKDRWNQLIKRLEPLHEPATDAQAQAIMENLDFIRNNATIIKAAYANGDIDKGTFQWKKDRFGYSNGGYVREGITFAAKYGRS